MVTRFDGEISLSGEAAFSMTPRVVALPDGGFVTVTAATGTSMQDIFLQRYDALGNPVGQPTKVNTLIYNTQDQPDVAVMADGSFVVTWTSDTPSSGKDIYARVYNPDGSPRTDPFVTQSDSFGVPDQTRSDVIALANGRFAVAHYHDGGVNFDSVEFNIYNADGTIFKDIGRLSGRDPKIVQLANGNILFAYDEFDSVTESYRVNYTEYNSNGNVVAREKSVYNSSLTFASELFALSDGSAALVHENTHHSIDVTIFGVGDPRTIYVVGGADKGYNASAAQLKDGRFLIVWSDSTGLLKGRVYNLDGSVSTETFPINSGGTGEAVESSITVLADGRFTVAWSEKSSAGPYIAKAQTFDDRAAGVTVYGLDSADTYVGTDFDDGFYAGNGNDLLVDGGTGAGQGTGDRFFGEQGIDTVSYERATGGYGPASAIPISEPEPPPEISSAGWKT